MSHQDGVNICLDPRFPNYQPEDIEILQYSGTMLKWAKGFPLCDRNETSPFCLEWRFNAKDKTAKIDIYMKGTIVKIFYKIGVISFTDQLPRRPSFLTRIQVAPFHRQS